MSEIDNYLKEILAQMQEEQKKFHKSQEEKLDLKLLALDKDLEAFAQEVQQTLTGLAKEQKAWEESLRILQESYTELLEAFNILYNNLKKQ